MLLLQCFCKKVLRLSVVLLCTLVSANLHAAPDAKQVTRELAIISPYKAQIQALLQSNQPVINNIVTTLQDHDLPEHLLLIPMLESSYNPQAVSHTNAAGLWQLIPSTAKRFGLKVNHSQDQRLDPEASTKAAVKYLSFLYRKFDDIALSNAAYNAGEGRVARAILKAGSRDISKLTLPPETTRYVHRFFALMSLINIDNLITPSGRLFLFGQPPKAPLITLKPLPPLILIN